MMTKAELAKLVELNKMEKALADVTPSNLDNKNTINRLRTELNSQKMEIINLADRRVQRNKPAWSRKALVNNDQQAKSSS